MYGVITVIIRCRFKNWRSCDEGRFNDYHLLCGALFPFLKRIGDLAEAKRPRKFRTLPNGEIKMVPSPLEVVRLVADNGEPVVGIKAQNKAEMEHFVTNMVKGPRDKDDPLRKAHGSVYYDGPSVPGLKKRGV